MQYITHAQVKDVINTDEPFAVDNPTNVDCTLVYLDTNDGMGIIDGDGRPVFRGSGVVETLLYLNHWSIEVTKIEYRLNPEIADALGCTVKEMLMKLR